jgi:hypothetical protein
MATVEEHERFNREVRGALMLFRCTCPASDDCDPYLKYIGGQGGGDWYVHCDHHCGPLANNQTQAEALWMESFEQMLCNDGGGACMGAVHEYFAQRRAHPLQMEDIYPDAPLKK